MISFSGIDCSGKSTQIELVVKYYEAKGKKCKVIWSRGGYTPGVDLMKRIIRHGKTLTNEEKLAESVEVNNNPTKRKILFLVSLMDLWLFYTVSLRLKGINKEVICDRYIWDTYIDFKLKYPDFNFEHGFWWKLTLKTMIKPKHSFCLFIPAEISMYRSTLKEEPFPEKIELRQTRIKMYNEQAKKNRWEANIDANRSIKEVQADIIDILCEKDRTR